MQNNLLPEGFKDEVSSEVFIEHKYKNKIIEIFKTNGYELVKTPLIEFSNESNSINSLKIKVAKNKKELSLRNDITIQIARLAVSRLSKKIRPLKLCYYGEVVRNKGSMLRPERQFLQIGAECIGEKSYLADIEIIELAYNALYAIGVKDISIELSSKVFLEKLYSKLKKNSQLNKLKSFIRKKDLNSSLKLIDKKYHTFLKNIFSCTGNFKDNIKILNKLKINKNYTIEINNIIKIYKFFSKKNFNINFFLDLTEIDDKNYHNGFRFTIFANNVRGEIARGGRYLSDYSGKQENATGFTCYMDTILRASSRIEKEKKILIPFDTSKAKKENLFKKNYIIEKFFGNKKDIKKMAIKKKCNSYLYKDIIKSIK